MTTAHRAPVTDPARLRGLLDALLPHAAEASVKALMDAAHSSDFVRRDRILTVDDVPRLVLVLAGHVGTWRSDAEGRSQLVALNGPGEFAALSALSTRAASVDLVALDAGTAVSWDPAAVRGLARTDAGLGGDLLDLALRAGDRLATRLEHVTFDSVSRRLARLLWQRRELLFDPRRPLLSRPQLGELAGATREMTDRVIRDLEAQGIVERTGTTGLILREPHALHLLAGDDDERECS